MSRELDYRFIFVLIFFLRSDNEAYFIRFEGGAMPYLNLITEEGL